MRVLLDENDRTRALLEGRVRSPLVDLEFERISPIPKGFARFVNDLAFDFGELAIVTFLQARAAGAPLVLMPAVMVGGLRHGSAVYNSDCGHITPETLAGRRVGIRSWTQTSPTWVRGILANDYGVQLDQIKWTTFEGPHVRSFHEPSFLTRAPEGSKLLDMLLAGDLDAAIGIGADSAADPRLKSLIPSPKQAGLEWNARHGIVPINHMAVVKADLSRDRPDVVRELFRMLEESRKAGGDPGPGLDVRPYGVEANRKSLETIIRYSFEQGLIPEAPEVDDLFDDTTRSLGA